MNLRDGRLLRLSLKTLPAGALQLRLTASMARGMIRRRQSCAADQRPYQNAHGKTCGRAIQPIQNIFAIFEPKS